MPFELEVSLGPEWVKKVIVVSHERSGTHFLMNTIADNFGYLSFPWIDMDLNQPINWWAPENLLSFLMSLKGQPVVNLIKSHHQVEFFLPVLPQILDEFHLFYIWRSHGEVMESLRKHIEAIPWTAGPKVKTADELAVSAPSGSLLRYQSRQYPTMLERLKEHQRGWFEDVPQDIRKWIHYVAFTDLRDDFERTVKVLAKMLGRPEPTMVKVPDKDDRVITPGGKWLE